MPEQSGETEHLLPSLTQYTEHFSWYQTETKYSLLQFLYKFLGRQIFKWNNELRAFTSLTALVFHLKNLITLTEKASDVDAPCIFKALASFLGNMVFR